MDVTEHAGAAAFLAQAEGFLLENEAENNLPLGIAHSVLRSGADAFFATVDAGGAPRAAAVWTPPHRVLLGGRHAEAFAALAAHLSRRSLRPAGAMGVAGIVERFAAEYAALAGVHVEIAFRDRLYALARVIWPRPIPGLLRSARDDEAAILADWLFAFAREAGVGAPSRDEALAATRGRIAEGALFVWDDGGPVSMASLSRPTATGIAVTYVYTPDGLRGRGYAKAAVARLSQRALDSGRRSVYLFADLANEVSNHVYRSIGYEGSTDMVVVDFVDG